MVPAAVEAPASEGRDRSGIARAKAWGSRILSGFVKFSRHLIADAPMPLQGPLPTSWEVRP